MCGIFGILYHQRSNQPEQQLLAATASKLDHRGPDNYAIYQGHGIGLVHTRLSLLDLNTRSNQPFWDQSGRYCLVYNGEIYNYQALKSDLTNRGVDFKTTSDTEVLLQCLIHDDIECLPKLEGMFAFALWDDVEQTLTLAMDRFGIKPLYIFQDEHMFMFSSEIKGMQPWLELTPDPLTVSAFLLGSSGPTKGLTFFNNIRRVTPGSVIKISKGGHSEVDTFFSLTDFLDNERITRLAALSNKELIDETEALLVQSVNKHLLADAPVGALCSGGLDSSLIMAMAAKQHKDLAIFHANVEGPFSEYDAAQTLAKHLKLDLKSVSITDQDFIQHMPKVMRHHESPFLYHPNSIPFLKVSQLVRDNSVKAILSGEGADEAFLGYPSLAFEHIVLKCHSLSTRLGSLISKVPVIGIALWPQYSHQDMLAKDLHTRFEITLEQQDTYNSIKTFKGTGIHHRDTQTLNLLKYHLRTLLHRNDRLGMAASIEARFPFLDHDLIKAAVNMPYKAKLRFSPKALDRRNLFLRDKWIIRKVAERYLPKELSQRRKQGFYVNAFDRMQISSDFFQDTHLADILKLSSHAQQYLLDQSPQNLRVRLLMLDVWAHICLYDLPEDQLLAKFSKHLSI